MKRIPLPRFRTVPSCLLGAWAAFSTASAADKPPKPDGSFKHINHYTVPHELGERFGQEQRQESDGAEEVQDSGVHGRPHFFFFILFARIRPMGRLTPPATTMPRPAPREPLAADWAESRSAASCPMRNWPSGRVLAS